ncbi:MAG TPA: helix-turn-helix domain-containing protein [Burkholderiales bacterium]|nr:helix-turn-helix domain-containing protein [Burkholderiales bacterium]
MGTAHESIKRGLNEAIAHAKGKAKGVKVYEPKRVDVAALRHRIGMTQEQFAARFGVSVATLRHWERGDRTPQGPALVLLNVIAHNPRAVMQALT